MQFLWILMVAAGVLALFFMGVRWAGGRRERVPTAEHHDRDGRGGRDLGANINPSQLGNEVDLFPDRTGARTRRELGARHAADVTFSGEREENNKTALGVRQSDPARPAPHPGIRREVDDGLVEARKGPATTENAPATADLDPEDAYGEDRPANRTVPPDQPPTQWHPREHGVPGDHIRDGHHRSATAPERQSKATDPFAHGPTPGPNHIPPESGVDFPDEIRP
ncbi:MAG: hypothetical protein ACOY94_12355 [Bacillota bacterium]